MTSRTSMLLGPMLGLAVLILSLSLGRPASAHEFAVLYARNTSFVPTSTTSQLPCPTWTPWTCPVGQAPHTTFSAGCLFPAGCTTRIVCPTTTIPPCPTGYSSYYTTSSGCIWVAGCTSTSTRPCPTATPPRCSTGYGTGYTTSSGCSFPTCTPCPVAAITPCVTGQTTVYSSSAGCTWAAGCTGIPRCTTYTCSSCPSGQTRTTYTTNGGCPYPCGCRATPTPEPTNQILWGQCGGNNWTGPRICAEGRCSCYNEWYCECRFIFKQPVY